MVGLCIGMVVRIFLVSVPILVYNLLIDGGAYHLLGYLGTSILNKRDDKRSLCMSCLLNQQAHKNDNEYGKWGRLMRLTSGELISVNDK